MDESEPESGSSVPSHSSTTLHGLMAQLQVYPRTKVLQETCYIVGIK